MLVLSYCGGNVSLGSYIKKYSQVSTAESFLHDSSPYRAPIGFPQELSPKKYSIATRKWREASYVITKYVTLPCGLFWTQGNQDTEGSKETYFSLKYIKNSDRGLGSEKESYYQRSLLSEFPTYMARQTSNYQTSYLIVLPSALLPFEAPVCYSIPSLMMAYKP